MCEMRRGIEMQNKNVLWRRMKVGMEIIYACVSGINMVMHKMQLCCPCEKPERWICFAVQTKKVQLQNTVYCNEKYLNKMVISCICFQAVGPRLKFSIWSTSRAPNPQFSEQEVSQLWAPQCHAEWLSTPNLVRPFVDLTASCIPNRPLNPARFPL